MNRRNLAARIAIVLAAAAMGAGCARLPARSQAPELIDLDTMAERGWGRLMITGYAPGWVQLRVQTAPGIERFEVALGAGRILTSQSDPNLVFLTLAGSAVPATRSSTLSVLAPVVSLSGVLEDSADLTRPTNAAATAASSSYKLDDSLMREELLKIASSVSSPGRKWRPTRKDAIVAPHAARHLKRAVFAANELEWSRARDFFAERTPIQLAVWMLLYNFSGAQLERELVVYGPGMEALSGRARQQAIRAAVADTFSLWVAMEYSPDGSNLASDFPELAKQAKANKGAAAIGDSFPGSDSPLRPIAMSEASDLALLADEALLVEKDFGR